MIERPALVWEGLGAEELGARWGVAQVHLFDSLGSTSDVARRLAAAGAPAGTVVVSDEQVAGRGRAGRSWASAARLGLWFSVVARPDAAGEGGPLPLRIGLAAAEALDAFLPAPGAGIKWPNDLVAGDRKLGGILCESSWEGHRPGAIVAGVGVNVLHEQADFQAELRLLATSLRLEAGGPVSRLDLADALIPAVASALRADALLDDETCARLAFRDVLSGHPVEVSDAMSGVPIARGIASGILSDGSLLLRDDQGAERPIHSGTVRRISFAVK